MNRIKKNALFLIDGSYILYRSYYGMRPLKNSKGVYVQAVYGFCRAVKKLMDMFDPRYLSIVWDSKGKTFRSKIFEAYKATRDAAPSDLFEQKKYITKFADLIGIKQIAKVGYEADDLIASMAQSYSGEQVVIIGADKDLLQLLSNKIIIYDPFKEEIVDKKQFKEHRGYGPDKLPFYHSLLGDASDNIPGVKGIGKKGATDLVLQFDSLDDLYNNLDRIKKERTRRLLQEGEKNAYLSFKLFLLGASNLIVGTEGIEFDKNKYINAASLFEEFEFKFLLNDLKKIFGKKEVESCLKIKSAVKIGRDATQMSLFEKPLDKVEAKLKPEKDSWNCHTILTYSDLDVLIKNMENCSEIAIDTETTGLRPLQNELVGISFAFNNKEAFYIPFSHKDHSAKQLNRTLVLEKLKPLFLSKKIDKIMQNAKFDLLVLKHYGADVNNVTFDTLIAASLLRRENDKINLKVLSATYLNEPMNTFEQIVEKRYKNFSYVPLDRAAKYAAYDSLQTLKLKPILERKLKEIKKLHTLFIKLEMPLSFVLFKMELEGIHLDVKKLNEIGKEIELDLKKVKDKIFGLIESGPAKKWKDINLSSPKQLETFLFDELKLPALKRTLKGKRSTGEEVLAKLSKVHPIPVLILQYRELMKLLSTYIDSLIKEVNPKTSRIHTSFSQTLVKTGRLSSSNPNMQNIPASSEYGLKIRSAFTARKGCLLLAADYSQIELRVLAYMSKDKNLLNAFNNNIDIHLQTSAQIFDIPIELVTKKQRQIGKRINFSIIYGLTPYGLSQDLGIKPSEAKEYIDRYFETYKGVAKWIEHTIKKAKEIGYVQTLMGRRRYISGLQEKNKHLYQAAARIAINSPVQGSSAEIIKKAMINIVNIFEKKDLNAKMILQIHDELVLEVPIPEIETVQKIVKKEMETVVKWKVPLLIVSKVGKNWALVTK